MGEAPALYPVLLLLGPDEDTVVVSVWLDDLNRGDLGNQKVLGDCREEKHRKVTL